MRVWQPAGGGDQGQVQTRGLERAPARVCRSDITSDVGLQGLSPSQYVYKICLEFLLIQEVIFIVLIVIPADPPLCPVLAAMCDVKVLCLPPCDI